MGRHHDKKYGIASGASSGYGRYGMKTGGLGGLLALVPVLGLGVVIALFLAMVRRRRALKWGLGRVAAGGIATTGVAATTGIAATNCASTCATVGLNEKLVAAERLPGVKYREVDVITRKRVS